MMKYLAYSKILIISEMAYKFEFVMNILSTIVQMFVLFFLWSAIFSWNNTATIGGFTLSEMITYAVVGVVIARILNTFIEWYIEEDVKTGNIVMMLTKPLNYVWYNAAISLGEYSDAFIRTALPSFIICILIFHIFVPDPLTLILAFISVFLGAAVLFLISFILGTFAFWTTGSIWFLRSLKQTSITLLSGSFIPLAFFPELLRNIADVLPFQTIYHVPLSIYLGKISGFAMLQAFAIQIFWIVLLAVIATLTWKAARRRFVALGG